MIIMMMTSKVTVMTPAMTATNTEAEKERKWIDLTVFSWWLPRNAKSVNILSLMSDPVIVLEMLGTDVVTDSVESEIALIVVAVVCTVLTWGSLVVIWGSVGVTSAGSHTLSEVVLPFLTTVLPWQLRRNKDRGQRSEVLTAVCRCDSPSLTLCEADRGPCRRRCQRTSHLGTVHTSHLTFLSLRTTHRYVAVYLHLTIRHQFSFTHFFNNHKTR